jgi:group I intron endonuclease
MGAVYLIRNNNKKLIYIGKDNDDSAKTRWADHLSGTRFHCLSLRKAMAEYGPHNFTCRVIENGLFRDELRNVEMWWIRVFNAGDPAVGYNTIGKIPRGEDKPISS